MKKSAYEFSSLDLSAPGRTKGRPPKWPFLTMDVGEAVTIDEKKSFHSARTCFGYAAKSQGKTFSSKTLDDGRLLVVRTS